MTYDIGRLKSALAGLKIEDNPAIVQQKSRDFFWYSPVLKRELDHVTADLVVSPKNEAEVIRVLAACHELGVPVTPRGTRHRQLRPGDAAGRRRRPQPRRDEPVEADRPRPGGRRARARSSPTIDRATRAHSGQEIRLHPSTYNTASIGGFIAGGSGGVGSINWGGLRDLGNVLRLRVVTMEAEPARPRAHRRGPAEGDARLRHQRHHHRGRDAARRRL